MLLWLATALSAGTAGAQAPADSLVRDLRAFYAPLIGLVTVELVDRSATGGIDYQARQTREFAYAMNGRYVREVQLNATAPRSEGGLLLHGVAGRSIRTYNFWGADADGLFVTWTFDGRARLVGTGTEQVSGVPTPMRAEMAWEDGALVWRTWVRPSDGTEYLDHTLVYRRLPR